MRRRKGVAVFLAAALVMTLLPVTAFAAADETLTVGAGEAYTTIQEAVDAALNSTEAGTKTIIIKAGTYNETVHIVQKAGIDVVLQGESVTVLMGNIIVEGERRSTGTDTLKIQNIVFDKSGQPGSGYIIDMYNYAHNITIENCSFVGDSTGEWFAINAGKTNSQAYRLTVKDCTFSRLDCAVQGRCHGMTLENVTATDMRAGINTQNSTNITLKNVKIYASEYALRVGENSGTTEPVNISIENSVLSSSSTDPTKSAIVLRVSTRGDINIKSSDILGDVYNASSSVTVTTGDVYWGIGNTITGFSEGQLVRNNDAKAPHWIQNSGESEVRAKADITYTIVITPSVDFGTIDRKMPTQTKTFTVAVEDALIEDEASITVENTTAEMLMRDKDGTGNETLAFTLAQPGGLFTFMQEALADGEEAINSSVSCEPSQLTAAGSYKGYMMFTVSYVTP
jgi:hypothetical protein